jgi:exodeoxyribonuclease VII small subunit
MAKTSPSAAKPPISDTPEQSALPVTYEAGLKELEALVRRVESGDLPLDELLTSYQRGAQLLTFCRDKLQAIETQVKVLDGTLLKPWVAGDVGR